MNAVALTLFKSQAARTKREATMTLAEIAQMIRDTHAESKDRLPWLKLGRFGTAKSENGSLRTDANMLAATGLELDCDGGAWSLDDAEAFFRQHGICALLFDSPSANSKPNRWRALLPFSRERSIETRREIVEQLLILIPGLDAGSSRAASRAFFFGSPVEGWTPRTLIVEGSPVDTVALPKQETAGKSGWNDESGSGAAWRLAIEAHRSGATFEEFVEAVESDPEALRSCEASPRGYDAQLERDWDRARKKCEGDGSQAVNAQDVFDDLGDEPKRAKRNRGLTFVDSGGYDSLSLPRSILSPACFTTRPSRSSMARRAAERLSTAYICSARQRWGARVSECRRRRVGASTLDSKASQELRRASPRGAYKTASRTIP